ncbi:50S ribosomal protein L10 [bacterium]|nr:MAG: 50S ribosomal protein L10 [bacterium]
MKKHEKIQVVNLFSRVFNANEADFPVNFKGLSVKQMQALRKELRHDGGSLRVSKARLIKRAVGDLEGGQQFVPYLKEQVAVVFAQKDFPAVAKVLHGFSKKHEALQLVAGLLEAKVVDKKAIVRIADLPTKEVLIAQLCGLLNAPAGRMASLLHKLIARLLYVLKTISEQNAG